MSRVIMHIDLNAFFATCEQLVDPSLINKPMAVGWPGRRGIILTASYEARPFGIHSGMPTFMAVEKLPTLIIKKPNFELYSRYSSLFFSFLYRYSSIVESASIDEAFVDMTQALQGIADPQKHLIDLQNNLFNETGLKCSIGIGSTKFLSKMGSDLKKPMGLTIIRKKDIPSILFPLPIESLYGIGKKTAPRLKTLGINTIGDFYNSQNSEAPKLLGKFYDVLIQWLNGNGDDQVHTEPSISKSIGQMTTFDFNTNDSDTILSIIEGLCTQLSKKVKEERLVVRTIQLLMKTADFKSITRSVTLEQRFNDKKTIFDLAKQLFLKNHQGKMLRLVGVSLQNLSPELEEFEQMSLFSNQEDEGKDNIRLLIKDMNKKLKKDLLFRASDLKVNK